MCPCTLQGYSQCLLWGVAFLAEPAELHVMRMPVDLDNPAAGPRKDMCAVHAPAEHIAL